MPRDFFAVCLILGSFIPIFRGTWPGALIGISMIIIGIVIYQMNAPDKRKD